MSKLGALTVIHQCTFTLFLKQHSLAIFGQVRCLKLIKLIDMFLLLRINLSLWFQTVVIFYWQCSWLGHRPRLRCGRQKAGGRWRPGELPLRWNWPPGGPNPLGPPLCPSPQSALASAPVPPGEKHLILHFKEAVLRDFRPLFSSDNSFWSFQRYRVPFKCPFLKIIWGVRWDKKVNEGKVIKVILEFFNNFQSCIMKQYSTIRSPINWKIPGVHNIMLRQSSAWY